MQNKSFVITLGLTALTSLANLSMNLSPSLSQSTSSESHPNKVTFLCREEFDTASGEKIPATIAWIPERKGHVYVIGWKSEYFNKGGWTPEKRCQEVTKKFQAAYEQGHLNYLFYGKGEKGYPIICGLANQGESCNSNHQLFTVKSGSNPEQILQGLINTLEGNASEPILQSSGEQIYIDVQNILKKAPLINS